MRIGVLAACSVLLFAVVVDAETPVSEQPAELVKGGQPKYPPKAFRNGVQGTVVIEFTVNEKGEPKDLKIIESIPALDEAALDCVKKWRFIPAKQAGKPVATQARAPVTFRITGRKR